MHLPSRFHFKVALLPGFPAPWAGLSLGCLSTVCSVGLVGAVKYFNFLLARSIFLQLEGPFDKHWTFQSRNEEENEGTARGARSSEERELTGLSGFIFTTSSHPSPPHPLPPALNWLADIFVVDTVPPLLTCRHNKGLRVASPGWLGPLFSLRIQHPFLHDSFMTP